jgi:hypothetical protein
MKYAQVEWSKAACAGMDTQKFYEIEDRMPDATIHSFRAVCMACPIWEQCLRYAFTNEKYGMWGGLTTRERDLFWYEQDYYHQDWQRLSDSLAHYGININHVNLMYLEEHNLKGVDNASARQTN